MIGAHYVRMPKAGSIAFVMGAAIMSISVIVGLMAGYSLEALLLLSENVNGQFITRYGMAVGLCVSGGLLVGVKHWTKP